MSSIPIKNGVIVHLPEYGMWTQSDMYYIGGCFIFVCTKPRFSEPFQRLHDVSVTLQGNTIERDEDHYSTIIVLRENVQFHDLELIALVDRYGDKTHA